MVEQALLERFPQQQHGAIDRVLISWRLLDQGYVHHAQIGSNKNSRQESHSYFPGLTVQEFWNDHQQPAWCDQLAALYPQIRAELDAVLAVQQSQQSQQQTDEWAGALSDDAAAYGPGWKTLVLLHRGLWHTSHVTDLFPVTSRLLHDLDDLPAVEIFFAQMDPQSTIQRHSDFTSFVLTCHLGLDIPTNGECTLTVGDTTVAWDNGNVLLFDTSIHHAAQNTSPDRVRTILMLRVWHPDVTAIEREALQFIYDVLECPELIDPDPAVRREAEQALQKAKVFPLAAGIVNNNKTKKGGFGAARTATNSRGGGKKLKSKRKRRS